MIKKLTRKQCGQKRWAGISKEKRSAEMRERANQLWAKIKKGGLSTPLTSSQK